MRLKTCLNLLEYLEKLKSYGMTFHFVLKFGLKSHFGPYEHLNHLKNHPGDLQMSYTGWWQSDLLPPGQAQLA